MPNWKEPGRDGQGCSQALLATTVSKLQIEFKENHLTENLIRDDQTLEVKGRQELKIKSNMNGKMNMLAINSVCKVV